MATDPIKSMASTADLRFMTMSTSLGISLEPKHLTETVRTRVIWQIFHIQATDMDLTLAISLLKKTLFLKLDSFAVTILDTTPPSRDLVQGPGQSS